MGAGGPPRGPPREPLPVTGGDQTAGLAVLVRGPFGLAHSASGESFVEKHDGRALRRVVVGRRYIGAVHAAASESVIGPAAACRSRSRSALRGRPRGRLRGMIVPRSKISPPQTPHGSRLARAPARHSARTGHPTQSALARSRSAG